MVVVVVNELLTNGMIWMEPDGIGLEWDCKIVQLGMVIRTETQDVLNNVWPSVKASKWSNVVRFRITLSIR